MEIKIKDLLPIGTVVRLVGGTKKVMIYGVKQTDETSGIEYDYIASFYPEGTMGDVGSFLFNHDNVEEIYFRGYENEERTEFLNMLEDFYKNGR